jgi:hypothetical protein
MLELGPVSLGLLRLARESGASELRILPVALGGGPGHQREKQRPPDHESDQESRKEMDPAFQRRHAFIARDGEAVLLSGPLRSQGGQMSVELELPACFLELKLSLCLEAHLLLAFLLLALTLRSGLFGLPATCQFRLALCFFELGLLCGALAAQGRPKFQLAPLLLR